ncbi:hypothetical protein ACMGE7_05505 [Macrococcus equi]
MFSYQNFGYLNNVKSILSYFKGDSTMETKTKERKDILEQVKEIIGRK